MLNAYGMIFGVIFMQWLPLLIVASPLPAGWPRL